MNANRTAELLSLVFLVSGAAGLLFETLWFRQAGLTLGNSVWASSLVLAGFMGGLGVGNLLVARFGHRLKRVVLTYALIEVAIAGTGVALVFVLPHLTHIFAPVFRALEETPLLLNVARLAAAFTLTLIPSTAMGATLPLLVSALHRVTPNFGAVLGRLYGMNTLGAVAGALLGELLLIEWVGISGAAFFAGALNLTAAGLALTMRGLDEVATDTADTAPPHYSRTSRLLIVGSMLCGGILLGLEAVWFRFLNLFAFGSSLAFALMLSVVLAGIGAGSLVAGRIVDRWPSATSWLPALALGSGVVTLLSYLAMLPVVRLIPQMFAWDEIVASGIVLMLATCLLSGVIFTLIGSALDAERGADAIGSAGALVFANTVGAMVGPLLAGFVLLPTLGMERSLQLLAFGYVGVALLMVSAMGAARRGLLAGLAVALVASAVATSGLMADRFIEIRFDRYNARILAWVESIRGTLAIVEKEKFGEPLYHRLVTNSHAMSGTLYSGRRYMKLYVYIPVALHPKIEDALLISYGVGSTARALTDTPEIGHIDIVDVSQDTLDLSDLVYPDPTTHPLNDPRVEVHIEDGRYFLETTTRRFDLITGEPPPPKNAGIVTLYTREYFQLAHDRLKPGGFMTYWLPVHGLHESETRAIIGAFCDVFATCSLWHGWGPEWMLLGQREGGARVTEARYAAQWNPPRDEIVRLGIERPEQLGALFIGDQDLMRQWRANEEPLVDNYPLRLRTDAPPAHFMDIYYGWLDPERSRSDFASSATVAGWIPEKARQRTLGYFPWQDAISRDEFLQYADVSERLRSAEVLLRETDLLIAPLIVLGSDPDTVAAARSAKARGRTEADIDRLIGMGALAEREYVAAVDALASTDAVELKAFARCMADAEPTCAPAP